MNRQSGVKIFLSVITAPIVLGHLIDFLNRRCHVKPQWSNIQPTNLNRLAYSRYKHVRANTIGVVNVHILNMQSGSNGKLVSSYWPKFAALHLFVETMPILKLYQQETEIMSCTEKRHQTRLNPRSPQC